MVIVKFLDVFLETLGYVLVESSIRSHLGVVKVKYISLDLLTVH